MTDERSEEIIGSTVGLGRISRVALSIRQPWAWLIINACKDVENRCWPTRIRGTVLIHAAKGMTRMEYETARMFLVTDIPQDIELPPFEALERGGIVGHMSIEACVTDHPSPWFCGPYGFVIAGAGNLPFTPCRGALGFFKPNAPDQRPGAKT